MYVHFEFRVHYSPATLYRVYVCDLCFSGGCGFLCFVLFCFLTLKLIEKELNVFLVPGFLMLFHMHLVSKQNSLS